MTPATNLTQQRRCRRLLRICESRGMFLRIFMKYFKDKLQRANLILYHIFKIMSS